MRVGMKEKLFNVYSYPFVVVAVLFCWLMSSQIAMAGVKIESWQTPQGSKVMYVSAPELPLLDIQISFDAGSARDGEQYGLASMAVSLQGLKTKQYDEQTLSQKINDLGAVMGGGVNRDQAYFSMRTLTRPQIMQPALALFAQTMSESVFDQAIFAREQQRRIVALQQDALDPSSIASKAFWKLLYGSHPYAHPVYGTVESVQALVLKDVERFYKKYIVASNATIAIVGNVTKAQAEKITATLLKGLPEGKKPTPIAKPSTQPTQQQVIAFDSSQTYFKQGQIGVERGHSDYFALFLGNHLLGGSGFGSLLMEEVREKRGLVYGVGSGFSPMKQAGPWLVSLSTKNDSANEAQKVVNETVVAFMKSIDDEHFEAIKENLIGGFPLRIDSNGKIISYIGMIGFYDLPLDYLDAFPKKIAALSKEDVLQAWQRNMQPSTMSSIMVGKPQ